MLVIVPKTPYARPARWSLSRKLRLRYSVRTSDNAKKLAEMISCRQMQTHSSAGQARRAIALLNGDTRALKTWPASTPQR